MPVSFLSKGACCGNWFPLDYLSISNSVINEIGILLYFCLAVVPNSHYGPCQGWGVVWWASSSNTVSYKTISSPESTLQQHQNNLSLWFHVGSVNLLLSGKKIQFSLHKICFSWCHHSSLQANDDNMVLKEGDYKWVKTRLLVNHKVVMKCCLTLRKSFDLPFNQSAFTSRCRCPYW